MWDESIVCYRVLRYNVNTMIEGISKMHKNAAEKKKSNNCNKKGEA